jgi:WXG100 family type VII secretion target
MTKIRINTEYVRETGRRFANQGSRVSEMAQELQRAINSLDTSSWDGRSRHQAEPLLDRVRPESTRVMEDLDALGRKLLYIAETFETEDSRAARNLEGMPWVDFNTNPNAPVSTEIAAELGAIAVVGQIFDTMERIRNWLAGKGWKTNEELRVESDAKRLRQVSNISNYLNSKSELRLENWEQLSLEDRELVLAEIETEIAKLQGRPPASVAVSNEWLHGRHIGDPMPTTTNGYYNHTSGDIVLNSNLVENNDPTRVLETLIHEGRHAYQHTAVDDPSIESDPSKINEWSDNFDDYQDPEVDGFRAYYEQPVEVDARTYATDVLDSYRN